MSDDSCPICCDKFTVQLRKPVKCQYCEFSACTVCSKKYLTEGLLDAHCMSCRRAWNDEFLDINFTRAFRTGAYKKHREDILLDREVALLPTRQPRVEARVKMGEVEEQMKEVHAALREWELKRQEILKKSNGLSKKLTRYSAEAEGRPPPAWTLAEGEKAGGADRAKFVMKCPDGGCRGFLSTAYKCGTCQMWACPDCLVIKGKEKDSEHTCDPGVKETVALIIRESKACPKCGERISKIDGCFAPNTPVLLWNGDAKMSQDITVGDELVGDDGEVRTVQGICSGEDEMYEVSQSRGMTYTVNSKHTLTLFCGTLISPHPDIIGPFQDSSNPCIYDIPVSDYLALPDTVKEGLYGYKSDGTASSLRLRSVGRGQYYGWSVSGNKRFLLKDMTSCHNCDQMWCVDCHTAFSWTTGQLVTGVVHNPHYYEFLRQQGGGVAPRNAGDVPCGGVPYYHILQNCIKNLDKATQTLIMSVHRITAEITDYRMAIYQGHFNVDDNGDLGVKYLMKGIEKEDMKAELVKRELKRNKHLAIRAVLEMFVNTSTMMLNNIVSHPPGEAAVAALNTQKAKIKERNDAYTVLRAKFETATTTRMASTQLTERQKEKSDKEYADIQVEMKALYDEVELMVAKRVELEDAVKKAARTEFAAVVLAYMNLRTYVNESLMGVARMKNCSVPQIGDDWMWKPFNKCAPKARAKKDAVALPAAPQPPAAQQAT